MNRKEFIRLCALMGVGITAAPQLLSSCKKEEDLIEVNFSGNVIIIGAGAAGMMAAYTLEKYGINYQILEARNRFGGRVKQTSTFADFPIDLGAEWIHDDPDVFQRLVDDSSLTGSIELVPYQLNNMYDYTDGELNRKNWATPYYGEYKFKSSTWYQFFEDYIIPSIEDRIVYGAAISEIDSSGDQTIVTDRNSNQYTADKIILTCPIKVLQNNMISFTPSFSSERLTALNSIAVPSGLKAFFRFSHKFYPDLVNIGSILGDDAAEFMFYDAAFRKDTEDHVLGLFSVGAVTSDYTDLGSDEAIASKLLEMLDEIFDGLASQYHIDHVVQNWDSKEFTQGSYSHWGENHEQTIATLSEPIDEKIYFAGEAYDLENTATVHGAGFSGISTAKSIIQGN